jgi:elongation factor 1-gamma
MDPGLKKDIPDLLAYFQRLTSKVEFSSVYGSCKIGNIQLKPNVTKQEKKKKEERPKTPLELLPPSSMNLNDFKFWFINHEDRYQAFEEFVKDRLDIKSWSFWELKYIKHKGEGKKLYKTSNLLNEFIQRAEHFGKHSFGVHMICGEEPKLDIKGVWMWRGHEIPQAMQDHPQFDYYTTTKLDIDNLEDREYIKDMWCAKDGPLVDGTVIQTWKYQM